jgi:hypothetical protein
LAANRLAVQFHDERSFVPMLESTCRDQFRLLSFTAVSVLTTALYGEHLAPIAQLCTGG